MYTYDWNVDYSAYGRLVCKNCKHCCIGFPIKLPCCCALHEPDSNTDCSYFEPRKEE